MANSFRSTAASWGQSPASWPPRRSKRPPRASKTAQEAPKMAPRWPVRPPRGPQDGLQDENNQQHRITSSCKTQAHVPWRLLSASTSAQSCPQTHVWNFMTLTKKDASKRTWTLALVMDCTHSGAVFGVLGAPARPLGCLQTIRRERRGRAVIAKRLESAAAERSFCHSRRVRWRFELFISDT